MSSMIWEVFAYGVLIVLIGILLSITVGQNSEKEREQEANKLKERNYQLLTQLQRFRRGITYNKIMYHKTADRYCNFHRVRQNSTERKIIREFFENEKRIEQLSIPIVIGK